MRRITLLAAALAASVVPTGSFELGRACGQTAVGPAARSPFNPPSDAEAAPPTPLAVEGYCVVTLHDRQQWVLGDRRIAAAFDGREYLFAGPRRRAIFAAAPEKYASALGGDCVVTYAESGERVAGRIQYGAQRGGRLYFMASQECLQDFTANPAHYVDADLADGGHCPVTMLDEHRSVAGIPATVATHGGLRHFFASARQRTLFLMDPDRYERGGKSSTVGPSTSPGVASSSNRQPPTKSDVERNAAEADRGHGGGGDMLLNSQPLMGGYCPVTIRQTGAWVRGRYDYRVEFGPLVFLTAGPAEHDALMQDPARYVPALGGDCAVSLVDDGERVRGSIFHASEYQGRLFLFADAQRKSAFKADPDRYAMVDVAAAGACVVTQKDEGRTVPGLAKFAAWHAGLVYRFAGPAEKKKFLGAPERYAVESKPPAGDPAIDRAPAADAPADAAPQSTVAQ